MKSNKIILSSIAAILILSTNVNAQTKTLDSVDVWETEIISSSLNLGKNSIQTKQADHLSDLLRDLPGVDVGGTHSINNRINIRGLQDENLDITIDGAKVQNANMFHHIGNLLINPDILKKADIQVGTNSVTSGSLGGTISFKTKDGKDMLEKGETYGARVASTYNSNSSLSASLTAYAKASETLSFLLYHNKTEKGNVERPNGDETFGIKGTNKNTLVKTSYDINDNQSISISYDNITDEGDYLPRPNFSAESNYKKNGNKNTTFDTKYQRETITLNHVVNIDDSFNLETSLYSNKNELSRYEKWVGRSPRPQLEGMMEGKVKTLGINTKAQSNLDIGNTFNTITYGLVYDVQSSDASWRGSKYGKDEEAKTTAIYLEDAIDINNTFLITPGIKYNGYKYDGSYGNIDDNKLTYGLATEYSVTDEFTLLASATTLYKGVEMVDIFDSTRTLTANSNNLKAETGINKELGFKYISDNIGFSFKYFNTDIKDYISTKWNSNYTVATLYNNGELNLKGYEASLKYKKEDLTTLLTYSHSQSEFKNSKEPAKFEPGDKISLNIDYKINPNTNLSWNSIAVLKETDVQSTSGITQKDAYDVHNIALSIKPASIKRLSIVAGVDNIFNKEYITHTSENMTKGTIFYGDYEPGRNYKITLAYKF